MLLLLFPFGLSVHAGCDTTAGALSEKDSSKLRGQIDAAFGDWATAAFSAVPSWREQSAVQLTFRTGRREIPHADGRFGMLGGDNSDRQRGQGLSGLRLTQAALSADRIGRPKLNLEMQFVQPARRSRRFQRLLIAFLTATQATDNCCKLADLSTDNLISTAHTLGEPTPYASRKKEHRNGIASPAERIIQDCLR